MRAIVTMGTALGVALAVPVAAFAHGGSHPTPWPTPGTPTPGGTPPPSGKPPSGGSRSTGQGPAASTGGWEKWWELNKWSFTSVARTDVQLSGGTDVASPEEQSAAKTTLTKWLLECLAHEYYDIRSAAALALGKAGDRAATDKLIALIDDSNKEVQESAVLALGLLKNESVLPTIVSKVLSNPALPTRLRAAGAIAIGFIGSKAGTPELAKLLKDAKEDEVKYGALAGLGLLADESAGPHLIKVLFDKKAPEPIRAYAATALGKCGVVNFTLIEGDKEKKINVPQYLVHILKGEPKERLLAQSAVQALGALDAVAQIEDVGWVLDQHRDKPTQSFAALVLARLAKKGNDKHKAWARNKLEKLLDGRNHDARGFAAIALGLLGEAPSAVPLRKSFENESDPSLKAACAIGLGLLKDEASVPAFQGKIMASSDTKLRGYCCIALGLIGHQNAVKDLERVVEISTVPELKAAAAISLAMMGNQRAMPVLLKSLSEASNYVRQSTIVALGYFRNTRAVKPIQDVFDAADTNQETKAICVVALGYIIDRFDRPVFKQLAVDFNYLLPGEMTEQVLKLFDGRIARYKHPKEVIVVEALPKTALGKIRKEDVRQMVARAGCSQST